jgi:hypothetical protein
MPIVLPQQIIVSANNRYNTYYLNKGYEIIDKKIVVNVEDLTNLSKNSPT